MKHARKSIHVRSLLQNFTRGLPRLLLHAFLSVQHILYLFRLCAKLLSKVFTEEEEPVLTCSYLFV